MWKISVKSVAIGQIIKLRDEYYQSLRHADDFLGYGEVLVDTNKFVITAIEVSPEGSSVSLSYPGIEHIPIIKAPFEEIEYVFI